ncbi:hypothetical protein [Agriterribacter sp.]|uniref:hypothetical protein n=1 Tax=Agriterribacter sp. TaxID=2821509 RepID=UPI002C7995A7|nr:hypothetical protein [Agriterribacter sp.]HRO41708.1 hypothetical protein [Flavipsychrobacter sp.]HRP56439.1 hypothetical protein [Agriterribacter sp.]
MKKNVLGIVVIAIAIGVSAFNSNLSSSGTTELFWYEVNSAGVIPDASALMFSGQEQTKSYAETHSPCAPGATTDCLRGFAMKIPQGSFPNYAGLGAEQVKKP